MIQDSVVTIKLTKEEDENTANFQRISAMTKLQLQNISQTFSKGFLAILAGGVAFSFFVVMYSDHIRNDVRITILCTLLATGLWTLKNRNEHGVLSSRILVVILCTLIAEFALLPVVG